MKACLLQVAGALAVTFTLAACVPSAEPPSPAPPPPPVAAPTPAPAAAPATDPAPPVAMVPKYDNYLDAPQTLGTWTYIEEPGESLAVFGPSADNPLMMLRCDPDSGRIGIARVLDSEVTGTRPMQIQTETTMRMLEARPVASREPLLVAELPVRDPLLDAMAITKGRFALEVEGERTLYVPAWVEVTRVIEDCR